MESGLNYVVTSFVMNLIQRLCVDSDAKNNVGGNPLETEFYNTIEALSRVAAHSRQAPEG